jgi:hypothetical protein
MESDVRLRTILLAAVALTAPVTAFADNICGRCQMEFDRRLAICNADATSTEARELCLSRATANRTTCEETCTYGDGGPPRAN